MQGRLRRSTSTAGMHASRSSPRAHGVNVSRLLARGYRLPKLNSYVAKFLTVKLNQRNDVKTISIETSANWRKRQDEKREKQ